MKIKSPNLVLDVYRKVESLAWIRIFRTYLLPTSIVVTQVLKTVGNTG